MTMIKLNVYDRHESINPGTEKTHALIKANHISSVEKMVFDRVMITLTSGATLMVAASLERIQDLLEDKLGVEVISCE